MPERGTADSFKGSHDGETIFIVGSSPSLNELDCSVLSGRIVIGSNRILLHKTIFPTYLVLCDRAPYAEELKSGRLHEYAWNGGAILASTTIWDPRISCRGYPVQKEPDFDYWSWRVGTRSTPINTDSAFGPINSFGTIAGPMLQFGAIFGAKRLVMMGIDLYSPPKGKSMHFYECETERERTQTTGGSIAPKLAIELFSRFREKLNTSGIEIFNASPWKKTPIAEIFGNSQLEGLL